MYIFFIPCNIIILMVYNSVMAYRGSSGCGCLIAFLVVVCIISGVRGCTEKLINGDLKLPKLGSSHVSGGSGGYGTSNGYNVQYNQTTSPSKNNSLRDYTDTNNQPTEYREGRSENNNSSTAGSTTSYPVSTNNSSINTGILYKRCNYCDGTGTRTTLYLFEGLSGETCKTCGRSDRHIHEEKKVCVFCDGEGKIKEK